MFYRSTARLARQTLGSQRFLSKQSQPWGKSSPMYVTYILIGCVAFEVVYGSVTDSIWELLNKGKLFTHCNMERFKLEGQDDE